eukprot:2189983-Rhodomonas_salina.1
MALRFGIGAHNWVSGFAIRHHGLAIRHRTWRFGIGLRTWGIGVLGAELAVEDREVRKAARHPWRAPPNQLQ